MIKASNLEDLPPEIVDGAVAFIGDDKVKVSIGSRLL